MFDACTEFPKLGYMQIPVDSQSVGFDWTEWGEEEIESARETIGTIVEAIRGEKFWPPALIPPRNDEYGVLCGTGQRGVEEIGSDEEERQ